MGKISTYKDVNGVIIKEGDLVYAKLNDTTYLVKYGKHIREYDEDELIDFYIASLLFIENDEDEEVFEYLNDSDKYLEVIKKEIRK